MKKIFGIALSVLMLFVFASCGNTPAEEPSDKQTLHLSEIMTKIESQITLPAMISLSSADLSDFYGIEETEYSEFCVSICENSLQKDQIIMFKASDETYVDGIKEKLNTIRQGALDETENYLPEQFDLVSKSEVKVNGLYVTLFVSPDLAVINEIFNSSI